MCTKQVAGERQKSHSAHNSASIFGDLTKNKRQNFGEGCKKMFAGFNILDEQKGQDDDLLMQHPVDAFDTKSHSLGHSSSRHQQQMSHKNTPLFQNSEHFRILKGN